ncbi:MAG: arginine deiminase family protein [Candidatus Cyclobacteriaceae bacterium M3_2C_046]
MILNLNSEYATLKAVLMHRPGIEIDRLTPYNVKEYLFEDVPYLDEMQDEHDEFRLLIKEATGAKIYRLHELLTDVLSNENLLFEAVKTSLNLTGLGHMAEDLSYRLSPAECGGALIEGIKVKEVKNKFNGGYFKHMDDADYIMLPNPNFYFMRDPAAVVHNGVISCQMKFPGRQGETHSLKLIFENHPLFKEHYHQLYPLNYDRTYMPTIEGGDVIVLSKKALAIGYSERTDVEAIQEVAKEVLKDDQVERVYQVNLPKLRNCMHLDTVFTIIDENLIVTYPGAMDVELATIIYRKEEIDEEGNVILSKEIIKDSFLSVLNKEIQYLEVIETGGGNADYAAREQWYDGANVFAISPRRVISYNRNKHTNRALKEAGVEVLEIRSSELSRGLGGPRCMTMPLERQSY